jgi:hypothetical protein
MDPQPAKKRRSVRGLPFTAGAILVGGFAAVAVWTGKLGLGPSIAVALVVLVFGGYAFTAPLGAVAVLGAASLAFLWLDLVTAMLAVLGALVVLGAALMIFRE